MPGDDGRRFDDDQGGTPARPIRGMEYKPLLLLGALQHDQLMTKREALGLRAA